MKVDFFNPQIYDAQVQIFKVLTHPARLAILDILRNGDHCVCHIEAHLGYRQAYISQQLAVLREAGLIQDQREGWNIFYHVTDPRIYDVLDALRQMTGEQAAPGQSKAVICNCPKCSG
ncbi:MAG: metalloregulator ArsR/SmtB family transcription factor [Anaerolineae bacterium]|nr:metalloregulator ArsR/SmtB family transcription factor [Anaerolineae bacterium]